MDKEFWLGKWDRGEIGFHEDAPHPKLVRFLPDLCPSPGATIFLPLCGKSVDFDWLLGQGYCAKGIDFSRDAIEAVFDRVGIAPEINQVGGIAVYRSDQLTLYQGNFFELTKSILGKVDAVFDRAALVALPGDMRVRYAQHLADVTGCAPQILVTFEYDQNLMTGPPFSVDEDEVLTLYEGVYSAHLVETKPLSGMLGARTGGAQKTWIMK